MVEQKSWGSLLSATHNTAPVWCVKYDETGVIIQIHALINATTKIESDGNLTF